MSDFDSIFESEEKEDAKIRDLIRAEIAKMKFSGGAGISVSAKDGNIIISRRSTRQPIFQKAAEPGRFAHPFKIICYGSDWTVGTTGSSVTDGTNGLSPTIAGLGETSGFTGTQYIILSASIDTVTLEATDWEITAENSAPNEVVLNTDPTPAQTKANILLGMVTDEYPFVVQSVFTGLLLSHGLYNGIACRIFTPHPSHPDSL